MDRIWSSVITEMHSLGDKAMIESKLEKLNQRMLLLSSRVDTFHDLNRSMSKVLTTIDQRLDKLPDYNVMEKLQYRQKNLKQTLDSLQSVLCHYDPSICSLIHLGPADGNVEDFLAALNKLKISRNYFDKINPQDIELENVNIVYTDGCEALKNYYECLLNKHSTPLTPVQLIDLICEEDSVFPIMLSQYPPPKTRQELNTISRNWFHPNVGSSYTSIYSDSRSDMLLRSLQCLKQHLSSSCWQNDPLKPRILLKTHQHNPSRLQAIFEKNTFNEYETCFTISKRSDIAEKDQSSPNGGSTGFQELDQYLMLFLGLQKLLIRELQLLEEVIIDIDSVCHLLACRSFDMIRDEAKIITTKALESVDRNDWSAVLVVFSALKYITKSNINQFSDYVNLLDETRNLFKNTGKKILDTFLEQNQCETGSNLINTANCSLSENSVPSDATVHELTLNVIWFLKQLLGYVEVIGNVLFNVYNLDTLELDTFLQVIPANKYVAMFGLYIKKVLTNIEKIIVAKSEQYCDLATCLIFRLNNIHYILKSLRGSKLLEALQMTEADCKKYYKKVIRDLKNAYQRSWSRLLANVRPLDDLPIPINGRVKDKEQALLKERLTNFNTVLENAHKTQRSISIPDVVLRKSLKRNNEKHIIPQYNAIYEIYSNVYFSNNPEKYLKYRPQDVSAMLNTFFDEV